jgi:NitT/TauT family transport system substrate-binding protein
VRVASNVWVGYEPLFLARELGYYDHTKLRLVESSSNTTNLMALATGDAEAATLTLDEFLVAREGGLPLRVILVFDESAGADVVMARPDIRTLTDLRGKRIGVEETAVGALMYSQMLQAANLSPEEVVKRPLTTERHLAAYEAREVDALVTFEPYATRLAKAGARRLLDSSRFPGLIVDVLAARADALETSAEVFSRLVAGHFRALSYLQAEPARAAALMAPRMGIEPAEVLAALKGVHLLDLAANQAWLSGPQPRLIATARQVGQVMLENELLRAPPPVDGLVDARFLPPVPEKG